MAVVQISRIQIRRGQAQTGTGLPQLASGEMAWAVDTQELYIGNGSVAEGAPAVGNTKIVTQNDLTAQGNLLGLVQYAYKATDSTIVTGPNVNSQITRSIQARFDDQVNTAEFGATGNGVTDDTVALQRAVNQLFLNVTKSSATNLDGTPLIAAAKTRVTLTIPPGIYLTTSPLYIPSYATLVGAGADKTFIYYNPVITIQGSTINNSAVLSTTSASAYLLGATVVGTGIPANTVVSSVIAGASITLNKTATVSSGATLNTFTVTPAQPAIQLVNDASTAGNPSSISNTLGTTQPKGITISDLSIRVTTGLNTCIQLDAAKECVFENINLRGATAFSSFNAQSCGITLNAVSNIVTSDSNKFKNIKLDGFSYGVFAKGDILNNTFDNINTSDCYTGFGLGIGANGSTVGQQYGPRQTTISNSKFSNIKRQAVFINLGTGNATTNCKYINVGNNGGSNASASQYPQVWFNTFGNSSLNDQSDRAGDLSTSNLSHPYVPEVAGHAYYKSFGQQQILLGQVINPVMAFRLPVSTDQNGTPIGSINYEIEYFYQSISNNFTRRGIITISANIDSRVIQLSDEYDFAGTDPNNQNSIQLSFSASFLDQTGGNYVGGAGQVPYSISVKYQNLLTSDAGYFNYTYFTAL
jgi:Pectate lyase superfamily protein/Major tropism determinant N-terminal domain